MTLRSLGRQMGPFDALMRLQNDLEHVFERPYRGLGLSTSGRGAFPPANIFRGENSYVVRLELPGVPADQISIETQLDSLRVSGKRDAQSGVGAAHRVERWSGEFARVVQLPSDAQLSSAHASYVNGVLSITVPLREEAKPRKIEIGQ